MRMQSSHSMDDRSLDAYWSPPEAVRALIAIEGRHIPKTIWEPACGSGAIVKPLRAAGYKVFATDIADYGFQSACPRIDYLKSEPFEVDGICTNPPFKLALQFAERAIRDHRYVAFLLRTNFLESMGRKIFFEKSPPSRVWISSRRLPMMHRHGWTGNRAPSNTAHAWFIWDREAPSGTRLHWFDYKDYSL